MLIYLDHNIIVYLSQDEKVYSHLPDGNYVYSALNLTEIGNSTSPDPYLDVLDRLNAKLIVPICDTVSVEGFVLENFPTDKCVVIDSITPREAFENRSKTSFVRHDNLNSFLAWFNGGKPNVDPESYRTLAKNFSNHALSESHSKSIINHFDATLIRGNDINKHRVELGVGGGVNHITGENVIMQIWDKVKNQTECSTPGQYFSLDYRPIYGAIVQCFFQFNVVGFAVDTKKWKKEEAQNNMSLDSSHAGMASYCDVFISNDDRLIRRTHAIFEYLNVPCDARYFKDLI